MRFAVVNDQRIEASPGAKGLCPACGAEMVAKCGDKNVWHWAHKGRLHCDHWWENETAWHRAWKSQFPIEWQEVPTRDGTGELHIADIKRDDGLVVEFQNSPIKPAEVVTRTRFYGNIVWIINGTRRKSDLPQYREMISYHRPQRFGGVDIYTVYAHETRLLKEWGSIVPYVGFDFGDDTLCLLTNGQSELRYLFNIQKDKFAKMIAEKEPLPVVVLGQPKSNRYRWRR
ncbi:hypothetical protein KUW14_03365 [Pseudooceanicola nitratireducens]|uniref:competence protein CoiA n=1 Tax=Pseudooceanicola nitratireducens TaxID=517719 RepID=UPI001C972E9A|nr:competence protein CoiA family protein [Pseudooceanicola nitratireducens]MBY6164878.1 hypothetical protein [Pseudooceanicola nitratireducens]